MAVVPHLDCLKVRQRVVIALRTVQCLLNIKGFCARLRPCGKRRSLQGPSGKLGVAAHFVEIITSAIPLLFTSEQLGENGVPVCIRDKPKNHSNLRRSSPWKHEESDFRFAWATRSFPVVNFSLLWSPNVSYDFWAACCFSPLRAGKYCNRCWNIWIKINCLWCISSHCFTISIH